MRYSDIEFYVLIGLALFTVWFIIDTVRYYYGQKRQIKHLHRFAREGESDAQVALAKRYQKGNMVRKSCQNAIFWYQKAAFSGDERGRSYFKKFLENYYNGGNKDKC